MVLRPPIERDSNESVMMIDLFELCSIPAFPLITISQISYIYPC